MENTYTKITKVSLYFFNYNRKSSINKKRKICFNPNSDTDSVEHGTWNSSTQLSYFMHPHNKEMSKSVSEYRKYTNTEFGTLPLQ